MTTLSSLLVIPEGLMGEAEGVKADTAVQPEDLANVATTGSYNDLIDKAFIPQPDIDYVPVTGGTFTGNVVFEGTVDYLSEKETVIYVTSNSTPQIDASAGSFFHLTITEANTVISFENSAAANNVSSFVLMLEGLDGAELTYANTVKWEMGNLVSTPANNEINILSFSTSDGGTNWYGYQHGSNMS